MKAEIGKSGERAARGRSGKVNDRTLESHKGCGTLYDGVGSVKRHVDCVAAK